MKNGLKLDEENYEKNTFLADLPNEDSELRINLYQKNSKKPSNKYPIIFTDVINMF